MWRVLFALLLVGCVDGVAYPRWTAVAVGTNVCGVDKNGALSCRATRMEHLATQKPIVSGLVADATLSCGIADDGTAVCIDARTDVHERTITAGQWRTLAVDASVGAMCGLLAGDTVGCAKVIDASTFDVAAQTPPGMFKAVGFSEGNLCTFDVAGAITCHGVVEVQEIGPFERMVCRGVCFGITAQGIWTPLSTHFSILSQNAADEVVLAEGSLPTTACMRTGTALRCISLKAPFGEVFSVADANVSGIAAGASEVCGLTPTGAPRCWDLQAGHEVFLVPQ